ncbi:DUF721 domain-containing protein [Schaalia georgiae]|nr:DUF721 domain-containing protein [Schaalia georgiae]
MSEGADEEFAARALERAQKVARARGYIRSTMPTWGIDEERPARTADGSSEYAAIEVDGAGAVEGADSSARRARMRAEAYGRAGAAPDAEADPEGDLGALRAALANRPDQWRKNPGMAPMRTQYRRASSLGNVLSRMIRRNQWDTPTRMGSIMAMWPAIVGEDIAAHATIETFEGHKLIVRCSSTAWAKNLHLYLPMIERRIAEEVGAGVVQQVVIRGPVAPSWRKGPLSVKGRGPRDTYG